MSVTSDTTGLESKGCAKRNNFNLLECTMIVLSHILQIIHNMISHGTVKNERKRVLSGKREARVFIGTVCCFQSFLNFTILFPKKVCPDNSMNIKRKVT